MKLKTLLASAVALFTYAFLLPLYNALYAIEVYNFLPPNPTPDNDLIAFVHRVLNLAIGIAGLIAVVFLVYNGIMYILSGGDETKVEKATKGITFALIGLVICFLSVMVITFVIQNILRVSPANL